jgi:outer membrane immunogenic protein
MSYLCLQVSWRRTLTRSVANGVLFLLFSPLLCAQVTPAGGEIGRTPEIELPIGFNAFWTNAPAGRCGCFWLIGGGTGVVANFTPRLSGVIDLVRAQASNINGTNEHLTIFNYQLGPRFSLRRHSRWVPYGQFLVGGTSVSFNHALYGQGGNVFSSTLGGGVTARLNNRIGLTVGEADWMFSKENNNVNSRQNNLRFTSGIIFRFLARR